ncbi:MAG: hypothetical protein JKY81_00295 [Colwellia sp.]|nr:hypothetical protein [Colwellia sp.]
MYKELGILLLLLGLMSCGGSDKAPEKNVIQEPTPVAVQKQALPIIAIDNKIEQVAVFIELANQVRFFHPSDGVGDTIWEKFIPYGIYRVANTSNQTEFVSVLQELFATIAPSLKINGQAAVDIDDFSGSERVQVYSSYGYKDAAETSSSIYRRTIKIESFDKLKSLGFLKSPRYQQTLPFGITIDLPLVQAVVNGKTFPDSARLTVDYDIDIQFSNIYARLNAAGKLWAVMQHYYPYLNELDLVWSNELTPLLTLCIESVSECGLGMRKLLTKTGDNHNFLSSKDTTLGAYSPPFGFAWLEEKAMLVYAKNTDSVAVIGDQLIAIDGIDIDTLLLAKQPYSLRADNKKNSQLITYELLRGQENQAVELTLITSNGEEYQLSTNRTEYAQDIKYAIYRTMTGNKTAKHLLLENQIHYVNLSALVDGDVEQMIEKVAEAKAVVLDLRNYPNWNGWTRFLPHFADYPIEALPMYTFYQLLPNQQAPNELLNAQSFVNRQPFIDIPIIVLASRYSISQNEHALGYVQHAGLPILGEATYGINGNVTYLHMLGGTDNGGLTVAFTSMKVNQHDGSPLRGVGIIPNIHVAVTIESIVQGEDIQLNKAVEYLQQQLEDEE